METFLRYIHSLLNICHDEVEVGEAKKSFAVVQIFVSNSSMKDPVNQYKNNCHYAYILYVNIINVPVFYPGTS